jgi:hypothetical protein
MTQFDNVTGIPSAGANPSSQFGTIASNNTNIVNWAAVDHIGFNATNGGLHKQASMINQAAPGLNGSDGVYFVNGGIPQFQNATSTYNIAIYPSPVVAATRGYTYLPGGFILQWGISSVTQGNHSILFTTGGGINFPTACYNVQITPVRDSDNVDIVYLRNTAFTTNGFDYHNTAATGITQISWIAIGN